VRRFIGVLSDLRRDLWLREREIHDLPTYVLKLGL
jgi:hypothetical protein